MAQNSLELNSTLGPPHHSIQNKEFSHQKEKMGIPKVDYTQLPDRPVSGLSPEFLAPDV